MIRIAAKIGLPGFPAAQALTAAASGCKTCVGEANKAKISA
jgi:hypothetical protein